MPSTFTVLNLNDNGAGSLRQAIFGANLAGGADIIHFNVAGTIQLTTGALPAISADVDIDATSAPGFATTPVVEINYNGFAGLQFNAGAAGSALQSLALVHAAGAGLTVNGGGSMLIVGNFIGLGLDGTTVAANGMDGLALNGSSNNTIGGTSAQDRNVISGNLGNGISINGSSGNQIVANYIGTDLTGTLDRANGANGILVTGSATDNTIGGVATGGNDPTGGVFVRPPQGNLISGNNADGVLITGAATQNQLSGNYIGTAASGSSPLGNALDGVAIDGADGNSLIGCTIQDDPFVFYNVISGNGANGLRITNANNTTIQANFFGVGADNNTAVGNAQNGVVVEGSSANTIMGGPIPLGNVDAANGQNGIVVRDTASGFVTYNTFCGLAAFSLNPNLGNGQDGMLITSSGDNILIRTNVVTRNSKDGIEIAGAAQAVRIAGNIVGLSTQGNQAMGNLGNGVEVDGNASDIIVGGPQPTFNIIPYNVISANGANGVAVDGNAHDVQINSSYIGTDLLGNVAFGNVLAGVFLGDGTLTTTVGSLDPTFRTVIGGNLGNGIEMLGSNGNTVLGTLIGTGAAGLLPLPNGANGVLISNSSGNLIGGTSSAHGTSSGPGNVIANSGANGVFVESGLHNSVLENSIFSNTLLGIDLGPEANKNQAPPVLTSILTVANTMQVSGVLNGLPNRTYRIEFFANDQALANGNPEGRTFLGFTLVNTDATGAARFTASLPVSTGQSLTATATDTGGNTSTFSAGILNGTPNQNFITKVYYVLLGRTPDAGGLAGWTSVLDQGVSPSQVVLDIETDGNHEYYARLVQSFYELYLNRPEGPSDGNNPAAMVDSLAAGETVEELRATFTDSVEFMTTRGNDSNAGFVNALYQTAFTTPNRLATDRGAMSFEQQLDSAVASRASISAAIFNSLEFQGMLVQGFYQDFLLRTGSDAEIAAWTNQIAGGMPDQQILANILGSAESHG